MLRPYHFVAGRSDETFGRYLVIAAIVFALCWLFNAWKLGKFRRKNKSSESPAERRRSRMLLALCACALLAVAVYLVGSGFQLRTDVFLEDHLVPPGKNEMTIVVGVTGSAGYTRAVKDVAEAPAVMELQFYSAFGGINGSIGEDHRFVLELDPRCTEICFVREDYIQPVLYKDAATGEWLRAE